MWAIPNPAAVGLQVSLEAVPCSLRMNVTLLGAAASR